MRIMHEGPCVLRFSTGQGQTASHLWTVDGSRIAYLTPDWRHALGLGAQLGEATYEVDDPNWPPGTTVTVEPLDAERWWSDRQPDEDLRGMLAELPFTPEAK